MRFIGLAWVLLPLLLEPGYSYAQLPPVQGQGPSSPVIEAVRVPEPVTIDGLLDEPAWATAPKATGFTQSVPQFGAVPSQRTEARVLYDDENLYVGIRLYDEFPDSIAAPLARRGTRAQDSDWVHVVIDSRLDRRTGFRFSVNPRGVQLDAYHFDDTEEDQAWEGVWEVETSIDSLGWTAEFRIPFSQLRFAGDGSEERTWGMQIVRDIARSGERIAWAPWGRADAGVVSRFGRLVGLRGVAAPRGVELIPYLSTELRRAPVQPGDPLARATDLKVKAGADLRLGLRRGLTLSGTFNPDFGQVEADPAEVNLTAFESFFGERRSFFTEGADAFRFGESRAFSRYGFEEFFYSRRIGQPPRRRLVGAEHAHVDAPEQTRILGAGKISGRTPGGWSVGIMNALTGRAEARFVDLDGVKQRATVEPLSNFFTARLRRDVGGGEGRIGGIATLTRRDLDEGTAPLMHRSAMLTGVDGSHAWADRRWALSAHVAVSRVTGDREAILRTQQEPARYYQRPDAAHLHLNPLRGSLEGHLAELSLARSGTWMGSLQLKQASPGFEINDLGFQGRSDSRSIVGLIGRNAERLWVFREHRFHVTSFHAWNFDGDRILDGHSGMVQGTLANLWSIGAGLGYRPEHMDDRLTRGGPLAVRPESREASGWIESDPRRSITFRASGRQQADVKGLRERDIEMRVELRPSPALRLQLTPRIIQTRNPAQYVLTVDDSAAIETFGARHVFATLDQKTASLELRADWAFERTVSLQLFLRPFASVGNFANFSEFTTPAAHVFDVYGEDRGTLCRYGRVYFVHPTTARGCPGARPDGDDESFTLKFADPSFHVRSLRGTAVLRWEFRPGSSLFLVWQQERDGSGASRDFRFGRDLAATFREPARNVLLLKASYWIGG